MREKGFGYTKPFKEVPISTEGGEYFDGGGVGEAVVYVYLVIFARYQPKYRCYQSHMTAIRLDMDDASHIRPVSA